MKNAKVLTTFLASALCINAWAQWNFTLPHARPVSKTDTACVTFIGDVMMHSRQLEYDCSDFLAQLSSITRDADVSIANMEFPMAGRPYTGYPSFSTPEKYVIDLADKGVDVFLTANNHVLDRGPAGLRRTISVYDRLRDSLGIQYTGTALDAEHGSSVNPLIINSKGIRFALINFTYGNNHKYDAEYPHVCMMSRDEVHEMIGRARSRNVDYIIALPHWGIEYKLRHSKEQEKWAQWLADQGVDLIVGAHPHVVQDSTHINGTPVFYSLGNVVSNMTAQNTRLGTAVTARFVKRPDGSTYMLEPELEFIWCTVPGTLTESYATIKVADYLGRRDEWIDPEDYDNMIATLLRVQEETGMIYTE